METEERGPHGHAMQVGVRSSPVVRRQQLNMAPYNAVLEYRGVPHHTGRAPTPHGTARTPKAGGGGDSSLPILAQNPRQKSPGPYEQAALQSGAHRTRRIPAQLFSRQAPRLPMVALTHGSLSARRLRRQATPFRAARAVVRRDRPVASAVDGPELHGPTGGRSAVDAPPGAEAYPYPT